MANTGDTGKTEKRSGRTGLWVLLLNVAVIGFLAWWEFGRGERPQRISLSEVRPSWLAAALVCFGVMLLTETLKYALMLRETAHPRPGSTGFRCAVLGKYFDNITPAGFGGQPFQMHYLKMAGCSNGVSGALPVVGFMGLQFSFVALGLVVFLFGNRVFEDYLSVRLIAWVGLVFYAFIPLCMVAFALAPKPLTALVLWGTRLLAKLHFLKEPERTAERATAALASYTASLRSFHRQPSLLAAVGGLSLLFWFAQLAMPWFVLRAFGAQLPFLHCVCNMVYLYAAIAVVFTPGNAGGAEASFYAIFSLLPTGSIFWAMLVWRLGCYYSWLISGAVLQIGTARRTDKSGGDESDRYGGS